MNGTYVFLLIIHLLVAYAAGRAARDKGYSYRTYCVIALLLPVVGLVIALALPDKGGEQTVAASESDKAIALREYKSLLDDGTITRDEFEVKKRELLG